MKMYESPIDLIVGEMQLNYENEIVKAVQQCGVNCNKEELIKALQYDRNQYEKGYADAKAEMQWIPCSERLPNVRQWVLCQCRVGIMDVLRLTADGRWYKHYPRTEYMSSFVVAWQPLPKAYEGRTE